ncbi:hypothetical protein ACLOJK_032692 [Asimina triloba]
MERSQPSHFHMTIDQKKANMLLSQADAHARWPALTTLKARLKSAISAASRRARAFKKFNSQVVIQNPDSLKVLLAYFSNEVKDELLPEYQTSRLYFMWGSVTGYCRKLTANPNHRLSAYARVTNRGLPSFPRVLLFQRQPQQPSTASLAQKPSHHSTSTAIILLPKGLSRRLSLPSFFFSFNLPSRADMLRSEEKLLPCPPPRPLAVERRWKATNELAPNCPRCNSSNTKFCYYNNYSLTQPRYFCKGCRRYWTKGGSLRNVPVGGGCRKNRRGKSARFSTDGVAVGGSNYGRLMPEVDASVLLGNDPVVNSCPLNGSDALNSNSSTIDLAAVYAKFLNQNPADSDSGIAAVPEFSGEFDVSSFNDFAPLDPIHQPPLQFAHEDSHVFECQANPLEGFHAGDWQQHFLSEFGTSDKVQVPDMDTSGFGLQPYSAEGIVHDMIDWSPNFMCQSSQMQELGSVLEDHVNLHSSFLCGNWSSFNLPSTFDTFSRP